MKKVCALLFIAASNYSHAALEVDEPGVCFYHDTKYGGTETCYRGDNIDVDWIGSANNDK